MAQVDRCPRCEAELPSDIPAGVCPRCLLRMGLDGSAPDVISGSEPGPMLDFPRDGRTGTSVLASLSVSLGPLPRVLLRDTEPNVNAGPVVRPTSPEVPCASDRPERLQLLGEIGRGGMGAVLKGRDVDLGRDLAIKVLLDSHRDQPDMVRRFVEEAQIAGQLQHPGVVPVYELGRFADQRPYFAMKLVKGRTLTTLLEERDGPDDGLPRFLSIFEQVSQTMAYAHSRGVIHRDLKPSNIMVGSFGEVQVMDWGLAKVLAQGGAAEDQRAGLTDPETVIRTVRSGTDSDLSMAGSVLGTPSYMAPEQARGEIESLDERCDVFSLGSILCEVLTGQPAFTGRSPGEIQRRAARGELVGAFGRLDSCGADAELVALAKDCLAAEVPDRPRNAGQLAGRATDYLAGVQERLHTAELARAVEAAQAVEARRTTEVAEGRVRAERKARRLTMGLAASVLALITLGGAGWAVMTSQRAGRLAATASGVHAALAESTLLLAQARAAPDDDPAKWTEALAAARRAEALLRQGEADTDLRGRVAKLVADLGRERAEAKLRVRDIESDRKLLTELEAIRGARSEHWQNVQTDAAYTTLFKGAGLDADRLKPAELGALVARRAVAVDLATYLDDWAFVRRNSPARLGKLSWQGLVAAARVADPDPWRDHLREHVGGGNIEALARLADDESALENQPAVSLILLAKNLVGQGNDRERAQRVLNRAWQLHPGDFWVNFELADLTWDANKGSYDQPETAIRFCSTAAALRPRSSMARNDLGLALANKGDIDAAIAAYREALRLKPDFAETHNNLGNALRAKGDAAAAIRAYHETIRLKPMSAEAYNNLGLVLANKGDIDGAIAAYKEAVRLKPSFAKARHSLEAVLHIKQTSSAATTEHSPVEAIALYPEALALKPSGAGNHRGSTPATPDDSGKGKSGTSAVPPLSIPPAALKPDVSGIFYANTGSKPVRSIDPLVAIAALEAAIRRSPSSPAAHNNLGNMHRALGRIDEAIASYRRVIRLKPDSAEAHCNLGDALRVTGALEESIAEYREAIRCKPDFPQARTKLSLATLQAKRGNQKPQQP